MKMVVVARPLVVVGDIFWVAMNNPGCRCSQFFTKWAQEDRVCRMGSKVEDLDSRREAAISVAKDFDAEIYVAEGGFSCESGYNLTTRLLDEHPDMTVICLGFNVQALDGIKCIAQIKIAIPNNYWW